MEIRDHPIEIKEEPLDGRRSQEGIPVPEPVVDRVIYRKSSPDQYPVPVRNTLPTQVIPNGLTNHSAALNLSRPDLSLPLPLPPGIPERPPPQPLPERPCLDRRASFSSSGQDDPSTDSEAVSLFSFYQNCSILILFLVMKILALKR